MPQLYLLLFLQFVLFFRTNNSEAISLLVETKAGTVQGKEQTTVGQNRPYLAFQGIPYAEPPIGDLRFEPPVPKAPWEGTYNATFDRSMCVQSSDPVLGSEDCLFINVYIPKTTNNKLAVMVFIFGGGFDGGSSNYSQYGPDYLLDNDVIVVTFNYRLGIFGFLSTGNLVVPGNNGLKDQTLALKWVQENIESFGGDAGNVAIFGQSAGSASVSYHLQSPLSQGLFHKAIMESGVSLCPWTLSRRIPEITKSISTSFLIITNSWEVAINGLRRVNATDLQTRTSTILTSQLLTQNPKDGLLLGPVIEPIHDTAFFTEKSHEFLSSGKIQKVPCIIGFNSLEGAYTFSDVFRIYLTKYDLVPSTMTPLDMNINNVLKKTAVGLKIKQTYFENVPISTSNDRLMRFLSDDQFVRGIREFVRLIYKTNSVYFYEFTYEGNLWGLTNRTYPGVTHSEELGYIWRSPFEPTPQDALVRERMTSMWTNFAKTGNPTPENSSLNFLWKQPIDENLAYLDIGNDLVMKERVEEEKMSFWDELYRISGIPPFDTY